MNALFLKRIVFNLVALGLLVTGGLTYRHFQMDITQARLRIDRGGKVIETACGPIQYSETGTGAPMLMVHGSGGGYDQGETMAKLIGDDYRWIAPSRFGYLGTPAPENASSELQADAHACLLDALGIERVGVVSVSGGGPSALMFARRYPERTAALVMIDAVSHTMPARPAYLSAVFSVFTNDFVFWSLVHLNKDGLLTMLGVPKEDQQALSAEDLDQARAFVESILPMTPRQQGQTLEQRMSEYDAAQIRQISAPTLVLHARNDTLVAFDQGQFTAEQVPGAQLIAMESGGHLAMMFDANADAMAQVQQFIAQHHQPGIATRGD